MRTVDFLRRFKSPPTAAIITVARSRLASFCIPLTRLGSCLSADFGSLSVWLSVGGAKVRDCSEWFVNISLLFLIRSMIFCYGPFSTHRSTSVNTQRLTTDFSGANKLKSVHSQNSTSIPHHCFLTAVREYKAKQFRSPLVQAVALLLIVAYSQRRIC